MNRYGSIIGFGILVIVFGALGSYVLGSGPIRITQPPPSATSTLVGLDPSCAQWVKNNPIQPGSKFGIEISTLKVDSNIRVGESVEIMKITSTGSKGFMFCGYPYPPDPNIIGWSPWTGGLVPGLMTTVRITAFKSGTIDEKVTIYDLSSGIGKDIIIHIVVK